MARSKFLLDTGPLVALFDRRDSYHAAVVNFFRDADADYLTSWPVMTEACHFLPVAKRMNIMGMVAAGKIGVADIGGGGLRMMGLFGKYSDRSPDLADVSLIYLAELTGVHDIATIDVGDFSVYRIGGRSRFRIVGP